MDEIEEQIEDAQEMTKAREALAALFEEGAIKETSMATGGPICPTCKGSGSCPPCSSTGLARHPDGKVAYCPRCWGFGCCLHCRGQGLLLKETPEAPCRVCGNVMGNHQPCRIAEYQMARLEAMLNARVEP